MILFKKNLMGKLLNIQESNEKNILAFSWIIKPSYYLQ